jgi:hypothetical protein
MPETISHRLKEQFVPVYLTLSSIIQGVALAILAARVEATYASFDATNWLLTIATFIVILAVWNEYLMQVLAFVWMPTLLDSLVPFAFLACELFLGHFVYQGLRNWLLTLGLTLLVGIAAQFLTSTQTRVYADENRDIAHVLGPGGRIRAVFVAVLLVLYLCAWALFDVLQIGQIQFVVAFVVCLTIIVFVGSSVPYWNRLLVYALSENAQPERKGR